MAVALADLSNSNRETYRQRNTVERCINRLKGFGGIATRYDKTATSYEAAVTLASSPSGQDPFEDRPLEAVETVARQHRLDGAVDQLPRDQAAHGRGERDRGMPCCATKVPGRAIAWPPARAALARQEPRHQAN